MSSYKSQYSQDKFVNDHFFRNKRNGTFVDVGAHNGVDYSNTYFFEKELGWNGLCVEPLTDRFEELTKNRNCICVNGCVFNKNDTVIFKSISGHAEMLSGIDSCFDPKHSQRISNELIFHGGSSEISEKKSYTLETLLDENKICHVDYLSVDVEGSEFEVLSGINFDKVQIDVIDIENNYHDPKIGKFLEEKNFKLVCRIACDEIFVSTKANF